MIIRSKKLDVLVKNTSQIIQVVSIGAVDVYDRHSNGYYMTEFISLSYTLQKNKTIDG